MKLKMLLFVAALITSHVSAAQEAERNAFKDDIVGNWKLIELPLELQPKILPSNPWPAQCQWYSYGADGTLKSIDKSGKDVSCDALSNNEFETVLPHIQSVVSWKYDLSPVYQKGLVIVSRTDVQNYHEIWEPHLVVKSYAKGGEEFREGDLLLYLVRLQDKQIVWIRHLRRL